MEANSGTVTIRFRVTAPDFTNLFITGDVIELGNGRLNQALKLTPADHGCFEGSLNIRMTKKSEIEIKYKYISHSTSRYIEERRERMLRISLGQKLIQKIDEYDEQYDAMPEPWMIQIEELVGRSVEKKKQLGKPPKDAIQVQFVVKATLPHPTCRVVVFGNSKFLGNWNLLLGKTMQYTMLKWELDCFIAPSGFPLEYKYAIIDANDQVLYEDKVRRISLGDLAEKQATGMNVAVKINDCFLQEDMSGMSFPFEERFYRVLPTSDRLNAYRSQFRELLSLDARTGKLIASHNFYAQLALDCGKDCILNMEGFTTHDFTATDLVHEQFCKALLEPRSKVRLIELCPKYFANISPKRISLMNHVLETCPRITTLQLAFNSCCGQQNHSETRFIYEGLRSGQFKFITSVVFCECDMSDLMPVIEMMKSNKNLKDIAFFGCTEDREGSLAEHVLDQLFMNRTLTSIALKQTISKKGMETLQKLLTTDETLLSLNIGFINSDLQPFTEALKYNRTLQRLTVTGFGFPKHAITWLLRTLRSNETLQQFSLKCSTAPNKFSDARDLSTAIHELFDSNKTLTKMEITIGEEMLHEQLIHEYTSRNKTIQRTIHNDLIVVLFNIARHHSNHQSLQLFPCEIWLLIVKYVPGRQYDKILNVLFDDWSIRKVV